MSIYIFKNNQQEGPFEEAKVLEMLKSGQLSPNDMGIRQGGKDWQKLGSLFPGVVNAPPITPPVSAPVASAGAAALNQSAPKKSRKGLLLGCGGFMLVGLLIAGVLGFLAFRNLYPADSREDLPDTVKDLKLGTRYPPNGDIWGNVTKFRGIYSNSDKTQNVIYLMTIYKDDQTAKDAFRSELADTCKPGETPMNFSFKDKNEKEVSQGATCAVPLYVLKDNKLATIGGSADVETLITFAENLPFNVGTTMKKKDD